MLKVYLKIAFYHFWKNRIYLGINILSLAIGLSLIEMAYLHYQFGNNYDRFHENFENIYRLNTQLERRPGYEIKTALSPYALKDSLVKDFPKIKSIARVKVHFPVISRGKKSERVRVILAEPEFLDLFTFPLKRGKASVLEDTNQVIINPSLAEFYFGKRNPIGQTLRFKFEQKKGGYIIKELKVGGIFEEEPGNSTLQVKVAANFKLLESGDESPWINTLDGTFFLCDQPEILPEIENKLKRYLDYFNLARDANSAPANRFFIQSLWEMGDSEAMVYYNNFSTRLDRYQLYFPVGIALFILMLSTLNMVNSSINLVGKRLKEMGVKRVLGAHRTQIVRQFIFESLGLVFIAILFSLVLLEWLLGFWNPLFGYELKVIYLDSSFLLFLISLLGILSIIVGAYAGYIASNYPPVEILRDRSRLGSGGRLGKVLLGLQFSITSLAVFGGVISIQNYYFHRSLDYGFDRDKVISMNVNILEDKTKLEKALAKNPNIEGFSYSQTIMGRYDWSTRLKINQNDVKVGLSYVDPSYPKLIGLRLKEGRFFNAKQDQVRERKAIVNEELVKAYKWDKALGKEIIRGDTVYARVIGVVKNYYESSLENDDYHVRPAMLLLSKEEDNVILNIRFKKGKKEVVQKMVRKAWKRIDPETPIEWTEKMVFSESTEEVHKVLIAIFYAISFIASLISLAALYNSVSLEVVRRTKEIGIRKTYGARVWDIIQLLNKKFLSIILWAYVCTIPFMYLIFQGMLNGIWGTFTFPISAFIYSFILVMGLSFLTILLEVSRIANLNPIESLKYE